MVRKVDYTYEDALFDLLTHHFWINSEGHLDWNYTEAQENALFENTPELEKDLLGLLRQRGTPARMFDASSN